MEKLHENITSFEAKRDKQLPKLEQPKIKLTMQELIEKKRKMLGNKIVAKPPTPEPEEETIQTRPVGRPRKIYVKQNKKISPGIKLWQQVARDNGFLANGKRYPAKGTEDYKRLRKLYEEAKPRTEQQQQSDELNTSGL